MTATIANVLDDIDRTLHAKALNENSYEDYFVKTSQGRGNDTTARIIRKLRQAKDDNLKILFSGFRGCGKSTELLGLKRTLEDDFLIKILSVSDRLDPMNFTISEIILSLMKDLLYFVTENHHKIQLDEALIKKLENWANAVYKMDITHEYYEGNLGAGASIKTGIGKVVNVLAKLETDFKSGRTYQEITKKEIKHTLSELILNCNLIIREIKDQLPKIQKKNILFVVDELEKNTLEQAEEFFYNYTIQLTEIDCSIICTFPISLVYDPRYRIIADQFNEHITLPTIKVHDKNGDDFEPGIKSIEEIIDCRIDQQLIPRSILKDFIRFSGGCLSDLFRMIKAAADNALDREEQTIGQIDFQHGLNALKNDFFNTISYNRTRNLTAENYYDILARCCASPDKKPMDEEGLIDLRYNQSILGYNGGNWFDVHPVVREILKDKSKI